MNFQEFCEKANFSEEQMQILKSNWENLTLNWNNQLPFFLELEYIKKYYPLIQSKFALDDILSKFQEVITICKDQEFARLYLYILYNGFFILPNRVDLSSFKECSIFGKNSGIANLIVAIAPIELIFASFKKRSIPHNFAVDCLKWIGGAMQNYASGHNGEYGFCIEQMSWINKYILGILYRIGRLEYLIHPLPEWTPAVFRHKESGKLVVLCRDKIRLNSQGLAASRDASNDDCFITSLEFKDNCVTGTPITPQGFALLNKKVTINFSEYQSIVTPYEMVPSIHIPAGGKMSLEAIKDSLSQAVVFFSEYLKQDIKMFVCCSWIFNPAFEKFAPESNLSKFLQEVYLSYGWETSLYDGMFFVFGRNDVDPNTLAAKTSMQKLIQNIFKKEGTLRSQAMFILSEDIAKIGTQHYRNS